MTAPVPPNDDDVVAEHATNRRYRKLLDELGNQAVEVGGPANTAIVGNLRTPLPSSTSGTLIGRIGRTGGDPGDPATFYIGPRHLERDGLTVFSWAAPVASVFFETTTTRHEFAEHVAVVRTITTHIDDVVAVDDDWIGDEVSPSPFSEATSLSVPPPTSTTRRRAAPPTTEPEAEPSVGSSAAPAQHPPASNAEPTRLRAERAVRRALAAPRTGALAPVLATLQTDQYAVVARPGTPSLVVQGHPGTGKTVVAVHRAAYLTHPENGGNRVQRLLLLGPTQDWLEHVRPVLSGLLDQSGSRDQVQIADVTSWLTQLVGLPASPSGTPDGLSDEAEHRFAALATTAARNLAERNAWNPTAGSRATKVRAVYEELRTLARSDADLGSDASALAALRPWDNAVHERRLLPVLAQCAIALLDRTGVLETFEHVIVDEAQDLTRTEWTIVDRFNRGGGWTLVGDMNQRRTDRTHLNWEAVVDDLGLEEAEHHVLDVGFRSTQQILDYAAQTLPPGDRAIRSLQTGAPVTVEKVPSQGRIADMAMAQAERLVRAHPGGTVAIYTEQAGSVIPALVAAGWRKAAADSTITWRRDGQMICLHTPVSGRGIEFDAVVVLEPADIQMNLGRSGPLYTTLTRANRELTVVHHRALPEALNATRRGGLH